MKLLGVAPSSAASPEMLEPVPSRLPMPTSTDKLKRMQPMHRYAVQRIEHFQRMNRRCNVKFQAKLPRPSRRARTLQSDVDAVLHTRQLTPDELSALPCCQEFDRSVPAKSHCWLRQPMLGFFH